MVPPKLAENGTLRRALLFVGAAALLVSLVLTEPQTATDMAVATAGLVMVLAGLYLSRRAEDAVMEKVDREKAALEARPDSVPEEGELPRRNPFDGHREKDKED